MARGNQNAAGETVQAVDDSRTHVPPHGREVFIPREAGGNCGAGVNPGSGVDHHTGRLVDDDDRGVFVEDFEWDLLGNRAQAWNDSNSELDRIP